MVTDNLETTLISITIGYCCGSIPFGLIITRLAGWGDVRKIGSGNIGATNVLRTGNKVLATLTLALDGGKGALISLLAIELWSFETGLIAGLAAILGHNYPIWLKFRGGKGVATSLGTLMAVAWPIGITACLTWFLIALLFRYSSLSALVSLGLAPLFAWWNGLIEISVFSAVLFILSIIRHHENIKNLLNGNERKIKIKKNFS